MSETDNSSLTVREVQQSLATQESYAPTLSKEELDAMRQSFEENLNAGELKFHRIYIMQSNSPECAGSVEGYKPGQLIDSVTREVLTFSGKAPWLAGKIPDPQIPVFDYMPFLVIAKLPSEYIKWKDANLGEKGWHFRTFDRTEERVVSETFPAWAKNPNAKNPKTGRFFPPPVSEGMNFLVLPLTQKEDEPNGSGRILTFTKSSFSAGETLVSHIDAGLTRGVPPWGYVYYLRCQTETNPDGKTYKVISQIPKGRAIGRDQFDAALSSLCHKTAKALTGPGGKERQFAILNANADQIGSEDHSSGGSEGGAANSTTTNSEEQPF